MLAINIKMIRPTMNDFEFFMAIFFSDQVNNALKGILVWFFKLDNGKVVLV